MWFPDIERNKDKKQESLEYAVMALQVCSTCPIQKACLNFAMQDQDAIGYGIYGGTLPYERLENGALQWNARPIYEYQRRIRRMAVMKYQIKAPTVPKDVKPKRIFNTNYAKGWKVVQASLADDWEQSV
jgi:hypothetical protein